MSLGYVLKKIGRLAIAIFLLITLGIPTLMFFAVVILNAPFTSGVVAQETLENGVETCIVQYFEGLSEPYQVSLYAKHPDGDWRWHYLENEAERWRNARIELIEDTGVIYRHGRVRTKISLSKSNLTDKKAGYLPAHLSCKELNKVHKSNFHNP